MAQQIGAGYLTPAKYARVVQIPDHRYGRLKLCVYIEQSLWRAQDVCLV